MKVTLDDIKAARQVILNTIEKTPLDYSKSASNLVGAEVFLKLENNQRTGSFKIRGALNKISSLTPEEKKRGVIACSAGNHAQGVALSSTLNQVKSIIVMPETAPISKSQATKSYGAKVVHYGQMFDEARDHAMKLAEKEGYVFVHPYEDEKVIAGQGTIGLEIIEQSKGLDSIVIPIGGGGLISGVATCLKSLNPKIRVIGVQTESVSTMSQLFYNKTYKPIENNISTIADGIAIKQPSQKMYDSFISKLVDQIVTVSESEIAAAIVYLLERAKSVAEGAGAASMAAAMFHNKDLNLGKKTCLVVSGGNIDLNIIAQVIGRGQIQRGRTCELSVICPDVPGSLSKLTQTIAEQKANVLEVHHDRLRQGLHLKETRIDFLLETSSHEHIERLREAIAKLGIKVL